MINGFLRNVVNGYREQRTALPVIPPTSVDDIKDYQPDPPDRYAHLPSTQLASVAEPVQTIFGVLDFLGHVTEEVSEWIERETGEAFQPRLGAGKPAIIPTRAVSAASFSVRRVAVGSAAVPAAHARTDRRYVRLVNHGPNTAYFAAESPQPFPATGIPPNAAVIRFSDPANPASYHPVELSMTDEVWLICAVGETATVEVVDVYGDDE